VRTLHVSQAFWQHQARQILTLYEHVMTFCSNGLQIHFLVFFWGAPISSYMAKRLKGRVPKRKFVLPKESWISTSTFFQFLFLLMVLHDVIFNLVTGYEYERFKFFLKNLQVPWYWNSQWWPVWKNSISFIITNLSHIWSTWIRCDVQEIQKKGIPPTFHEFKNEEVHWKNTQKKLWYLNVIILWIPWNDKL
jgi:hypothetical protein